MWAPQWLRTLARRKSGEEANAESAAGLDEFAKGGITPGEPRIKGRLIGDAYVRYEPDATRFRQDLRPIPSWSPRHNYGGKGTIHRTTTVDIQIDKITGEVHAVWFRCLQLPFTVSEVHNDTQSNPVNTMAIEEITYVELPSEDSSQ